MPQDLLVGVGKAMSAPVIKAVEALKDIRDGLSDLELMTKHRLSARGLASLFRKLVAIGALDPVELEMRRLSEPRELSSEFAIDNEKPTPAIKDDRVSIIPKGRLLIVSDSKDVSQKIERALEESEELSTIIVDKIPPVSRVSSLAPLYTILDSSLGAARIIDFLQAIKASEILSVIVTLGSDSSPEVSDMLASGAHDAIALDQDPVPLKTSLFNAAKYAQLLKFRKDHQQVMEEEIEERTIELLQTKDFLKGILDSSTLVSVIATDMDQSILYWNKGAQNIFGYSAKEMVGAKISRLYPPDDQTKGTIDSLRRQARNKSGTAYAKMNQITKSGDIVTISLAITPMIGAAGEVQGILGVGLDVTEEVKQQKEIIELLAQVSKTQDVTVFTLAKLAESRDEETGLHLVRIQEYCRTLAESLIQDHPERDMLDLKYIDDLVQSSVLHDIGKVAIPDNILMCKDKFTKEQRKYMENHTIFGGKALEEGVRSLGKKSFLSLGMEVAFYHHERWDGAGYPHGLKGKEIPLSARIVALADVYDALTTQRRYKEAFTHESASRIIISQAGTQFDPDIVRAFERRDKDFRSIREKLS
jgi:PAS domain S-box-containing protein